MIENVKMPAWKLHDESDKWGKAKSRRRYWVFLSFVPLCLCIIILSEVVGRPDTFKKPKDALLTVWNSHVTHDNSTAPITDAKTSTHSWPEGFANVSVLGPEYVDDGHGKLSGLQEGWYSPNNLHRLQQKNNGDLILEERDPVAKSWTAIWRTGTGSLNHGNVKYRGKMTIRLDRQGVLRIDIQQMDGQNPTPGTVANEVWHSDLLASCGRAGVHSRQSPEISHSDESQKSKDPSSTSPFLRLHNTGKLETISSTGQVHCVLHAGTPGSLDTRNQYGRLAMIVAGYHRTLKQTCNSHLTHVVDHWPGSAVDIFVYTYWTSKDPKEQELQLTEIKECYGDRLKEVKIDDITKVEEPFPYPETPKNCLARGRGHLDTLTSQLKTLNLAFRLMTEYMMKTGVKYDAILRLRPDTNFHGGPLKLPSPASLGPNSVVAPHAGEGFYTYSHKMMGDIVITPSDQVVYGAPAPVAAWFDLYHHFPSIASVGQLGSAYASYTGCDYLPAGPGGQQCQNDLDSCSIEAIIPYYLSSRGISTVVDFDWEMSVLR